MEFPHLFAALFVLLLLLTAGVVLKRRDRRRRALASPFPASWLAIIQQNIPPYSRLSPEMQQQLQGYTQEFLYDKNFEGCGGPVPDDEIRVTIAAQAQPAATQPEGSLLPEAPLGARLSQCLRGKD